ncbi:MULTISPECIES: FxLD family lanthipeptide [unclassified Streptomyces]|uniref:FxLD family lanthipeptide n=1 Tax=unclassified Streptomyces TaxID=2593676 RepID=UPI000AB28B99|nr:FxLD family lanthipeptide [Streptomyces sp. TSRI0107]
MARVTAPLASKALDAPLSDDEWELETTITHSPTPIVEACDTSDGCKKTCASSCASS